MTNRDVIEKKLAEHFGGHLTESAHQLALEIAAALAESRKADVETVRGIVMAGMPHGASCDFPHGTGECSCEPFSKALAALSRLAGDE